MAMPSAPRALIDPCSGRTLKICPAVPGSTAVICSTLAEDHRGAGAVVEEAKMVMNRPGRRRSSAPRSAGAVIWYRPMEDPTGSAISGPPARAN
jgi:hypothetical protein